MCITPWLYIQNFCIFQFQVIILSIKPKTIAYVTQLTSLNTCVLHHGYLYRISVYFSSRCNSEYQTRNYCIYDPVNVSKYLCITPWLYIQNFCIFQFQVIILSIKPKTIAYVTQLTSLNTRVLHHGYIYRISVYFSSRYNSGYQTKNYCIYDPLNVSKYLCIAPWLYIQNFCIFQLQVIILSIKPKTIAYVTRLTAPITCVLHHGYIYRISVYFNSRL